VDTFAAVGVPWFVTVLWILEICSNLNHDNGSKNSEQEIIKCFRIFPTFHLLCTNLEIIKLIKLVLHFLSQNFPRGTEERHKIHVMVAGF
jgi:hypothetical protein